MSYPMTPRLPIKASQPAAPRGAIWPDTLPMPVDMDLPNAEPSPFRETLRGLHVRELLSEDLFHQFFGRR